MARRIPERTVGLALEDWPELDRTAWEEANEPGDILTDGGLASSWKPKTRRTAMKAYGNWLRFLRDHQRLGRAIQIGERLTEDNLRAYIKALRARVAPTTVVTQLRCLSQAIGAMGLVTDRSLLKHAISRLAAGAVPVRNKSEGLIEPRVLLDLGHTLMAGWQNRDAHDPRLNAMDYRDGLMIAFLALCPIRLANLAQMRIGEQLLLAGDGWRIQFAGAETKGGKAIDVAFPHSLVERFEFYLATVRPMIARDERTDHALWPSLRDTPMTEHGIYTRITRVMRKHLGLHITPHMFRDIVATHIAETAPDQALMAAPVLQHSSFETTRRHYIHGQQHKAARMYHKAVDERMRAAEDGAYDGCADDEVAEMEEADG